MSDIIKETNDAIAADRESAMKRREDRLTKQGKSVSDIVPVSPQIITKMAGLSLQDKVQALLEKRNTQKNDSKAIKQTSERKATPVPSTERGDCPSKDIVDSLIDKHSPSELIAIVSYISRTTRLNNASNSGISSDDFKVGDKVRCVAGPMNSVGVTGTVTQVKKTRLWVDVPGRKGVFYPLKCDMIVLHEKKPEVEAILQENVVDEPKSVDDIDITSETSVSADIDSVEQTGS
jgi:hypothetical protein